MSKSPDDTVPEYKAGPPPAYPDNNQAPGNYPPQGQPGYPPQGQPGYPPQGQPGYPPQGQPGYPPQGQPGYPPQGQPGYPPQGYPAPGQAGYVAPNMVSVQQAPATIVVTAGAGTCTQCGIGSLREDYTTCGIVLAVLFFPLGLLCCIMMKDRRCSHCGHPM